MYVCDHMGTSFIYVDTCVWHNIFVCVCVCVCVCECVCHKRYLCHVYTPVCVMELCDVLKCECEVCVCVCDACAMIVYAL